MLGSLIAKIREDRNMSKTDLAKMTGINVGHLTHIEKGERNPSQKALKSICDALNVPYEPLYYTYEKELTENQRQFNLINNVPYDEIPLITNVESLVPCPAKIPYASLAFRIQDDTMKGSLPRGTLVYLELNAIPEHKEFGLFSYNGTVMVRKLMYKRNKIVLKADNLLVKDFAVTPDDDFYIIGKIHV